MIYRGKCVRLRRRSARRGAEVLELALALPLLLVIAFGTIEFGFWFYLEHNFQSAAREGARAAVVSSHGNLAQRQAAAEAAADAIMANLKIRKQDYDVITQQSGEYFEVIIEADWSRVGVETGLFMRLHGGGQATELVNDSSKIRGKATMRIES
jgi:Flp pilus assembly protein TadG